MAKAKSTKPPVVGSAETTPRSPTLREIAARLGVCHATVSLALRNHASLPPATRLRIQTAAREMGYKNNPLVNALLTQVRSRHVQHRGEVVMWLTTLPAEEWQALPSVVIGLEAARPRAEWLGLRLDVMSIGPRGEHWPQVRRVLKARGVKALLLPQLPLDLLPLDIPWTDFAVVSISYSFTQAEVHRVVNAHFNGMMTCYKKLREAGRRRIGLVLRRDDDDRAHHYWFSGFMGASKLEGGASLRPLLLDTMEDGEASFVEWFEKARPDAIIGLSRHYVLKWLQKCGAKVPADVAYVCLDARLDDVRPEAGIRQSWGEIFRTAVELIAAQLAHNECGLPSVPKVTLIDGVWCDGDTFTSVSPSRDAQARSV